MKPSQPTPVTIPGSTASLQGILAVPPGARGVVLFAHGHRSGRASPRNRQVAEALHQAHLATLLLDLAPAADATISDTGASAEIGARAVKLLDATHWAAALAELAGLPLGYFGAGSGGAVALLAAAAQGPVARALVLRGGRADLARDAVSRVAAPTLLIVGGADTPVIRVNREAFARLRGEKELVLVPNASHLFEEVGAMETVTRFAVEWFTRYLPFPAGRRPGSSTP